MPTPYVVRDMFSLNTRKTARQRQKPSIKTELIVDNFAGGGGASMGMEKATGRAVDIAINHDEQAVQTHEFNHPATKHFCESVWVVDPIHVCGGRPVGLAWRFTKPSKRSAVPWWPEDTPVQPDPDAETDALVEWWAGIEGTLTDGCLWSLGVTVDHAATFRRSINELIGLWKLGDTDLGLKAQLTAHQRYREGSKDALLQRV